jgi:hypothetical protein
MSTVPHEAIYLPSNRLELLHRRRGLSDAQNGCVTCAARSGKISLDKLYHYWPLMQIQEERLCKWKEPASISLRQAPKQTNHTGTDYA